MNKLLELVKGKKTNIIAAIAIVLAIAGNYIDIPDWVFQMLLGGGALTLRDAIADIKKSSKKIIDVSK